ncbi:MAG: hypothetical protein HWE34_16835 [Methylocystaceae bacterium]|nr:hypothetical protein [Methylocystaceae bacterium]
MVKLVGLQHRGNVWRYRQWLPLNLRDRIGKSELIKSLETSDCQTAVRRYRIGRRDVEQIIAEPVVKVSMDDFDGSRLIQGSDTVELQFKAPPRYDNDSLRTLIKTVIEEVLEKHSPKKLSITLDNLYHRYMDDPARQRSKKTIMTYQSVYNVLMELFGRERLITDISREDCRQFLKVVRDLPALYCRFSIINNTR